MERKIPLKRQKATEMLSNNAIDNFNEQSRRKSNSRPRIFCISYSGRRAGGELFMAATGCLGVLCSCHNAHMSVAKFAEHVGLFTNNPGNSIFMENGESLLQWREKLFCQFGMQTPDDHLGWEWDEVNVPHRDHGKRRDISCPSSRREAATFAQEGGRVKKKVSQYSTSTVENPHVLRRTCAGVGSSGHVFQPGPQSQDEFIQACVGKSYTRCSGPLFNSNQRICNLNDNTPKGQDPSSTGFSNLENGSPLSNEHGYLDKNGSRSWGTQNASLPIDKNVRQRNGLQNSHNSVEHMARMEKDLSNFELRIGQCSQTKLSLESQYSKCLRSRLSARGINVPDSFAYELPCPTAFEHCTQQIANHEAVRRMMPLESFIGQQERLCTMNWSSSEPINSGGNKVLGYQSSMLHDIQKPPIHIGIDKTMENNAVNSLRSHTTHPCLNLKTASGQGKADLSSLGCSTLSNITQEHSLRDAAQGSQQDHQSGPFIRSVAKNGDDIENVEGVFASPPKKSHAMVQKNLAASSTVSPALKSSAIRQLTSWKKRGPYLAPPKGPLEHVSSSTTEQDAPSKIRYDACKNIVKKPKHCTSELKLKDLEKHNRGHFALFEEESDLHAGPNSESLQSQSISSEDNMQDEGFVRPVKENCVTRTSLIEEIFRPIRINKKMSGISKCTFSDEVVTRSDMSAAESDSIAEESPSSFVSLSARGNPLLHSSSRSLRSRGGIAGNSRTKDLKHNDAHDEGSGIGKCGSSIEADMEAMTNVGPASSHAYPQIIESQASVVNSSSTNALISDALSNNFNVLKPSVEADTTLRAVHGGEDLRENQVTVKRGKKPLKRRYLHGMFVEHVGKDNISWTKKNGTVMPHKRPILSDDTYQLSSTNGLKCKRWGSKFNPDFQSTKLRRVSSETFCYDREQTVQWQGPEPVVNPSEETREIFRSNVAKYARVVSTPKPVNYQDAASNFSMRKASSKSKPNLELQGMKVRKNMVIGRKTGPDIHDLKAAKMVSLSSILEFPKANATFHNKNCGISRLLPSNVSHYKEMNSQGLQIWRTANTHIYPERICYDASTGVEGLKLGSWTTAVKSRHHVLEVPITWVKNSKQIEFSLQEDIQKHTMQGCTIIGESSRSLDADEFEKKMITIPVKFISQKRIATEDLLKEAEDIVVSIGHDGVSGKPVKQLKSQGVYSELKSCSLISDSEKGSISSHEKSECMGTGRKKKHIKHPNCPNTKIKKKQLMICCVCGVSSGETNNSLVKCCRCDLVVHRACYGILQESKKSWVCRPCKDHAINSVCVLCGYGGGAMTRAKKSEALMKSLRQAWQEENDNKEIISCELNISNPSSSNESHECGGKDTKSNENVQNMFKKDEHIQEEDEPCKKEGLCVNSVLDAVDDPTVTQWVHVVCALWMPGTRCMNVRTMAGFDVSRVPSHRRKLVCSICKRAGGACIKCREPKCGIAFHPWCAHKKGLLQNEAFGGADDKVGFFGRCMLHGMVTDATCKEIEEKAPLQCRSDNHSSTCARTEGGYTRRGETSFGPLGVSREEVAAWLSIKEHKTYARRFIKLDSSDSELYKREYIRFIQDQRWKRLAVYKSNIHALGLYTSVFIARGEMVAEYVGEVVGLRMADKREAEYLSNKRLQYKGACYLFRIDDENIIDATRKGGIARFVNHSCSPNCVAKIISIGDQKKVVFFAEKDIAPGEELTYDYKLDFENENRIPCYCKSDQCRGYLN